MLLFHHREMGDERQTIQRAVTVHFIPSQWLTASSTYMVSKLDALTYNENPRD